MQCRHCLTEFAEEQVEHRIVVGKDHEGIYLVYRYNCPKKGCNKDNLVFIAVQSGKVLKRVSTGISPRGAEFGEYGVASSGDVLGIPEADTTISLPIRPRGSGRPPIPPEVDDSNVANDYDEACLVLIDSPKASAALSRRCLEQILEKKLGVGHEANLHNKIEVAKTKLPDYIANDLHVVREIGNFGAHPRKSTNTGEIMPVLPGEAEWNLDVIEELFEFLYVSPKKKQAVRDKVNQKLGEAGKKPLP